MSQNYPVSNIVDVFQRAEKSSNQRKPFIVAERELTFGAMSDSVRRLTRYYHNAGLAPGDRVVVATRDDLAAAVLFLSLLRNGIAAVLVDPETKPYRIGHIMQTSQPKGIILDAALRDAWKPDGVDFILEIKDSHREQETLLNKLLGKKTDEAPPDSYPALLRGVEGTDGPAAIDPELDAYILFTSGTTADPKGVRISHKNLFSHLRTLSRQFGYTPDSRILNILNLSHADGIIQGPVIAFANEATLHRPLRFEIRSLGRLLDAMYTFHITHFVTVPTVLSLIGRLCRDRADAFQTEDFRSIISTGAYLDAKLWRSFEEYFQVRVANVYGLTESVIGGLFSGPTDHDHCIGTVGKPSDCEVRIVNEQGVVVQRGEPGELLMKGDHVMKGYCSAPEATADALKDGWLYTGDIAMVDEKGFYRIVGRKKNIVIAGGINIHPEEVTEILKMSPHVMDAVTFGVPDETWGERVVSAVSLDNSGNMAEKELVAFCRERLEEAKVPDRVYVLPSLPKGPVGKVLIEEVKQAIRRIDAENGSDVSGGLEAQIISIAAACFNVSPGDLSIQAGPQDTTGWDSLAHMELVTTLEARFGVTFSPSEIMQIERLSDAWNIITEKLS